MKIKSKYPDGLIFLSGIKTSSNAGDIEKALRKSELGINSNNNKIIISIKVNVKNKCFCDFKSLSYSPFTKSYQA